MSPLAHPLVLWAAALVALAMALRARRPSSPERCPVSVPGPPAAVRIALRVPVPGGLAAALTPAGAGGLAVRAGLSGRLSGHAVGRARAGAALLGGALTLPLAVLAPPLALLVPASAGAGLLLPVRALHLQARTRRQALVRELPDLLDLLAICVEGGMALDPALEVAAGRLGGTLGGEVRQVMSDLRLGTPRATAYRGLVERTGSPELAQTVGALVQAEELGAPLSRALEGQAEALRIGRRQAARDRAAQAAPKVQLIVAMVMVPAVLLLVLGVLVIELTRQVGVVVGAG